MSVDLGWGIFGVNASTHDFIVEAIERTGGRVEGVFHYDNATIPDATAMSEEQNAAASSQSLLDDDRIEALFMSSCFADRRDYVVAAAKAGKHILCDQPFAVSPQDALAMVRACEEAGVILAVNYQLRSSPIHQSMQRMISAGDIGELRALLIVNAFHSRSGRYAPQTDCEATLYYKLSANDVDLASFLLDETPELVLALGESILRDNESVHDHAAYSLRMSGGRIVQIYESQVTTDTENQVVALGSEGSLVASGTFLHKFGGELVRRIGSRSEMVPMRANDLYFDTVETFSRAVRGDGKPRASGYDGLLAVTAAEAVSKAAVTGRSVPIVMPR